MKTWIGLLVPFGSLLTGWLALRLGLDLRQQAARLLTGYVIPPVITFNIATESYQTLLVMPAMAGVMTLLLLLHHRRQPDPVRSLCFAYLNIGWLGLPMATSLWGGEAGAILISAYVGSSVVGNTVGVHLLQKRGVAPGVGLRRILAMPACRAAVLGLLLMPWGASLLQYGGGAYQVAKTVMSFLGMAVLGAWLARHRPDRAAFRTALTLFIWRLPAFGLGFGVLLLLAGCWDVSLPSALLPCLLLICLLPPAANIVVLETHYRQGGHSAPLIAAGTGISLAAIGIYTLTLFLLKLGM